METDSTGCLSGWKGIIRLFSHGKLSGHPSPWQNSLSCCCSLLQGSHVTRWPGFYILQWKFHTMPACAATNLPRVDDVLASLQVSSHKCKVMYYTEVIGSEDFRFAPEREPLAAEATCSLSEALQQGCRKEGVAPAKCVS